MEVLLPELPPELPPEPPPTELPEPVVVLAPPTLLLPFARLDRRLSPSKLAKNVVNNVLTVSGALTSECTSAVTSE